MVITTVTKPHIVDCVPDTVPSVYINSVHAHWKLSYEEVK